MVAPLCPWLPQSVGTNRGLVIDPLGRNVVEPDVIGHLGGSVVELHAMRLLEGSVVMAPVIGKLGHDVLDPDALRPF